MNYLNWPALFSGRGDEDLQASTLIPGTWICLLSLLLWAEGEGLFTSAGISPTANNFIPLTPFETLLVGMFLLQIFVLQLYGIVPFDLNKFLHGDFSSMGFKKTVRRKRNCDDTKGTCDYHKIEMANQILGLILLVDQFDCVPRTLCEIQHSDQELALFRTLSESFNFLTGDFASGDNAPLLEGQGEIFQIFHQAMTLGINSSINLCQHSYSSCPLSTSDIEQYMESLDLDNLF